MQSQSVSTCTWKNRTAGQRSVPRVRATRTRNSMSRTPHYSLTLVIDDDVAGLAGGLGADDRAGEHSKTACILIIPV